MSDEQKPLDREGFKKAKRRTEVVEIPELGKVNLQKLSIWQVTHMPEDKENLNTMALMIVDEEGKQLFTDPDEIRDILGGLSVDVAGKLAEACARLNGISQPAIDDAIKNSQAGPSADSATA